MACFGEKLRAWRRSKNLTQKNAGERLGVSGATWSDWESENKIPIPANVTLLQKLTGGAVTKKDVNQAIAAKRDLAL